MLCIQACVTVSVRCVCRHLLVKRCTEAYLLVAQRETARDGALTGDTSTVFHFYGSQEWLQLLDGPSCYWTLQRQMYEHHFVAYMKTLDEGLTCVQA